MRRLLLPSLLLLARCAAERVLAPFNASRYNFSEAQAQAACVPQRLSSICPLHAGAQRKVCVRTMCTDGC